MAKKGFFLNAAAVFGKLNDGELSLPPMFPNIQSPYSSSPILEREGAWGNVGRHPSFFF